MTTETTDADQDAAATSTAERLDYLLTQASKAHDGFVSSVLCAAIHFAADDTLDNGLSYEQVCRATYNLVTGPATRFHARSSGTEATSVRTVRMLAGRIVAQSTADDLAAHPVLGNLRGMRRAVDTIIRAAWDEAGVRQRPAACMALHREIAVWADELQQAGLLRTMRVLASPAGTDVQVLSRHLCMHVQATYSHRRGKALGLALHRIIVQTARESRRAQ